MTTPTDTPGGHDEATEQNTAEHAVAARMMRVAMAEEFTSPAGERNPNWDWQQPDGPDNPYHRTRSMSERIEGTPMVFFTAEDGGRSMRTARFEEIAETLLRRGAVLPVEALTSEAWVERVIDTAFPDVHPMQRASVRRDVRLILETVTVLFTTGWCHCGYRVVGDESLGPAAMFLCEECLPVRCDTVPGACSPRDPSINTA